MRSFTRRQFLEQSLLAATAAATAPLAAEAQSPARQEGAPVSPNEKIRIAVIGVRGRGMDHVNGFASMPDVTVAAICDVDTSVAGRALDAVEQRTGQRPAFYQDIRKLLEAKDIDAVAIATPNHWHALASIWAMQTGRDVYVEKPVSHNVLEGRRMVQAARKYGRICQTGTQCRSMQGTIDAIRYVHEGKIGKVFLARGLCYKPRGSIGILPDGPVPPGVDYDLWLGPAPVRPFNPNRFHYQWHWFWDYGNGDLGNQGIHQMDIARWALNRNTLPRQVLSLGGRFGYVDQGETYNTQLVFLDYEDSQLIFEVRGLPTPDLLGAKIGVILYGSEGYVVLTSYTAGAAFDRDGKLVTRFNGGGNHYRNFIDAVRSRKHTDLTADIEEGHLSSALCHLGNISARLGRPTPFQAKTEAFGDDKEAIETFARFQEHLVANGIQLQETTYVLGRRLRIDPRRERFVGDREANAMLTREYREPFVVPNRV